ncbi:unnamed protein product, partial [Rhizoctonia solani]
MQSVESLTEHEDPDGQGTKGADHRRHNIFPGKVVTGHVKHTSMASHGVNIEQAETLRQSYQDIPPINTTQASPGRSMKNPRASLSRLRRLTHTRPRRDTHHSVKLPSSIDEALSSMNPVELRFFETLHEQVEKVDAFYKEREKDAILRVSALREQMEELRGHKKLIDEYRDGLWPGVLSVFGSTSSPRHQKAIKSAENSDESRPPSRERSHVNRAAHDPDAYRRAKKKLKKAVLEFYRGLEYLQNYR